MEEITANQLQAKLSNGEILNIIDVREVDEVSEGKIRGAVNIPLGDLELRLNELNKKEDYIVICRSGGRSFTAARLLENNGFTVTNVSGGMLEWSGDTV
jgi:rhodanese-related sulfurtransferase